MHNRLIIFTRFPEPGKTKRRLIPALGPDGAARVQREMTAHTLRWAGELARGDGLCAEVFFEGGNERLMRTCFGSELSYRSQGRGDLGQRMARAFADAFGAGIGRAAIIGSDCPGLTPELVRTAFDRLADHDVVLGPAVDGGYYLLALRGEVPQLFEGISWGTSEVLQQTLQAAARLGLSVGQLTPLADVDRPEDLEVWNRVKRAAGQERISVIIPTLNEAACLDETLRPLLGASNVETIVVDGNSHDGTGEIAAAHGVVVLEGSPGRARQMNAAAAAATGSALVFLHADSRLPEGFDAHVRRILARPGVIAGAFRLRIDGSRGSLRLIQRMATLRARYLRMPYGDQALFLRRDVFEQMGGFPELPIMEDYELVRRLRRRGRIAIAEAPVITSSRRWNALGPWRTTWINQKIVLGYHLGISPRRLARWYHGGYPSRVLGQRGA